MKNRERVVFLLSAVFMLFNNPIIADQGNDYGPFYEWINADEIAVLADGIYIDSHKGPMRLNVIDYDSREDRYLVESDFLELNGLRKSND